MRRNQPGSELLEKSLSLSRVQPRHRRMKDTLGETPSTGSVSPSPSLPTSDTDSTPSVLVEEQDGGQVWVVTINRPHARNAVDKPTAAELYRVFRRFDKDEVARVAILRGSKGQFCAGADLKQVAKGDSHVFVPPTEALTGPMGPTRLVCLRLYHSFLLSSLTLFSPVPLLPTPETQEACDCGDRRICRSGRTRVGSLG